MFWGGKFGLEVLVLDQPPSVLLILDGSGADVAIRIEFRGALSQHVAEPSIPMTPSKFSSATGTFCLKSFCIAIPDNKKELAKAG